MGKFLYFPHSHRENSVTLRWNSLLPLASRVSTKFGETNMNKRLQKIT